MYTFGLVFEMCFKVYFSEHPTIAIVIVKALSVHKLYLADSLLEQDSVHHQVSHLIDCTCDPTEIMNHVISIEAGSSTSACITDMNELYVWGMNVDYQVGNGSSYDARTPKFILGDISSVILAEEYSAAITLNGDLYMWGSNEKYALGIEDNKIHKTPVWVASDMMEISLSHLK